MLNFRDLIKAFDKKGKKVYTLKLFRKYIEKQTYLNHFNKVTECVCLSVPIDLF